MVTRFALCFFLCVFFYAMTGIWGAGGGHGGAGAGMGMGMGAGFMGTTPFAPAEGAAARPEEDFFVPKPVVAKGRVVEDPSAMRVRARDIEGAPPGDMYGVFAQAAFDEDVKEGLALFKEARAMQDASGLASAEGATIFVPNLDVFEEHAKPGTPPDKGLSTFRGGRMEPAHKQLLMRAHIARGHMKVSEAMQEKMTEMGFQDPRTGEFTHSDFYTPEEAMSMAQAGLAKPVFRPTLNDVYELSIQQKANGEGGYEPWVIMSDNQTGNIVAKARIAKAITAGDATIYTYEGGLMLPE